jgi:hypothetical protein
LLISGNPERLSSGIRNAVAPSVHSNLAQHPALLAKEICSSALRGWTASHLQPTIAGGSSLEQRHENRPEVSQRRQEPSTPCRQADCGVSGSTRGYHQGGGTERGRSGRAINAHETCSFTSQARRRLSSRLSGVGFAVIFCVCRRRTRARAIIVVER